MSNGKSSNINWVIAGWDALHQAVLDVGAEANYEPWENPGLWNRTIAYTDSYVALIQPLTQLIDHALEMPSIRAESTRILIWRKIRHLCRRTDPDVWRLLTEAPKGSNPEREYRRIQHSFPAGLEVKTPMSPAQAARHGYRLIWQNDYPGLGATGRILWGLALIGWSARHWTNTAMCELCFRYAIPGSRFCHEHSQSRVKGGERSAAYQRYRRARKVNRLAEKRGKLEALKGSATLRAANRHLTLADVIFDWDYEDVVIKEELAALHEGLRWAPHVLKKLGSEVFSLDFESLTETLREALDPHHWNPMFWQLTILQADLWFSLEEELSPGRRGRGLAAQEKIAKARMLASEGATKSEIAQVLNISPSAISKWIKRGLFQHDSTCRITAL